MGILLCHAGDAAEGRGERGALLASLGHRPLSCSPTQAGSLVFRKHALLARRWRATLKECREAAMDSLPFPSLTRDLKPCATGSKTEEGGRERLGYSEMQTFLLVREGAVLRRREQALATCLPKGPSSCPISPSSQQGPKTRRKLVL